MSSLHQLTNWLCNSGRHRLCLVLLVLQMFNGESSSEFTFQISPKLVNNCQSYGTFSKIQDGRRRHLGLGMQLPVSSFSGGT